MPEPDPIAALVAKVRQAATYLRGLGDHDPTGTETRMADDLERAAADASTALNQMRVDLAIERDRVASRRAADARRYRPEPDLLDRDVPLGWAGTAQDTQP